MSEITSHVELDKITKLSRGDLYNEAALNATIARIVDASGAASVKEIYKTLENFSEKTDLVLETNMKLRRKMLLMDA
jgi:hypothetical protein